MSTSVQEKTGGKATAPKEDENAPKPGRKPGQQAKEYDFEGLSPDLLAAPHEVSKQVAAQAAPRQQRNERQLIIDKVVKDLHNLYVAAGRPEQWPDQPKNRYDVSPAAAEGLRYLIRRAAEFHGVAVKFGASLPVAGDKELVVFSVRDKRTRNS